MAVSAPFNTHAHTAFIGPPVHTAADRCVVVVDAYRVKFVSLKHF